MHGLGEAGESNHNGFYCEPSRAKLKNQTMTGREQKDCRSVITFG